MSILFTQQHLLSPDRLLTLATEKSESGAEAIALEVGAYMGECIEIIEFYGGDVVKFLGDAVLVSFQPNISKRRPTSDPSATSSNDDNGSGPSRISPRKKNMLVRRAVECGLQLLARLSHYRVYLTAEERTKHRKESGEIERRSPDARTPNSDSHISIFDLKKSIQENDQEQAISPGIQSGSMSFSRYGISRWFERLRHARKKVQRRKNSSNSGVSTRNITAIDLELHIALSCGDITNIVIGNTEVDESDVNWAAPMYRLSPGLNSTFSYTPSAASNLSSSTSSSSPASDLNVPKEYYTQYHGRLEYAIGGPVVDSLDAALSVAKAGEMSITADAYAYVKNQVMQDDLTYDLRDGFYVVCNVNTRRRASTSSYGPATMLTVHGGGSGGAGTSISAAADPQNPNAEYLNEMPGLMRRASRMNIEPLIPRVRNKSYMQINMDNNMDLCKYINRSAVYRLRSYGDGNFPPQFREATIMFVSLGKIDVSKPEGLNIAQKALSIAIKIFVRYEGLLQQFAVDDKGATILGIFGLPPLSHEMEAPFAARASMALRDRYKAMGALLPDFSIALSTGKIFSAVVPQGNPYRRDPGIAGDAIVLGVRMLKFSFCKQAVVCDTETRQQIGGLCDFDDLGVNFVKGKVKPVQMYGINEFRHMTMQKRLSMHPVDVDFVGYETQMKESTAFANHWASAPNHHVLMVVGSSGTGKTFFCQNFQNAIASTHVTCCWSTCSEVEKGNKYYGVRGLLLTIMELIDSLPMPTIQPPHRQQSFGRTLDSSNTGTTPSSVGSVSRASLSRGTSNSEWFKRLTWGGSSSRITPTQSPSRYNDQEMSRSDEVILLRHCLEKCGEDERFLPLFAAVFPSISDETGENKYTRRLDSHTRDLLLSGIIVRIIQYASSNLNLVLICDDIQWSDPTSAHMLHLVHEVCQRVLLVIATRPAREYSTPMTDELRKTGTVLKINLHGLTHDNDIATVILQSFPKDVTRVSPTIMKMVKKRTEGNPLYIKNMSIIIKEYKLAIVSGDQLVPTKDRKDMDEILGEVSYGRLIKLQFDRLQGCFQEFLTVASCLDQYFDVYEVQAGVGADNAIFKNPNPKKIHAEIKKHDLYRFLRQSEPAGNVGESTLEVYAFTHVSIPKSIYDITSFETRNTLHKRLARYYESQLNQENYVQLLGKVTRHYLETDMLDKQLYYLEALADLDMRSNLISEATSNLQNIANILNDNEDISSRFGLMHKSNIYRRLGICLTMRSDHCSAEKYLHMALKCLGMPWPTNSGQFVIEFWKGRLKQFHHRHLFRRWHSKKTMVTKELGRRITEIMMQLCNIYYFCGEGEKFIYACLKGLNVCESMNDVGSRYTFFLSRMALLSWINGHIDDSVYYMSRAFDYMGPKLEPGTLNICAILCFGAGQFSKADQYLQRSIDLTRTLGVVTDCQEFYRAVRVLVTMRLFQGSLDDSKFEQGLMQLMADTGHRNNDHEVQIHLAIYQVANTCIKWRLHNASPYILWLESKIPTTSEYNQMAIHGVLICYYSRHGDHLHALDHTRGLLDLLPALSMSVNLFPVIGLMFLIMAIYRSTESGSFVYWHAIQKDYSKYVSFVNQIIRALTRVKYWSVTQPFIYLARALPYLVTNRTVEAYKILHSGMIDLVPTMLEIPFLRGYYLSKLGRFAFTMDDRIAWTREAEKLFREVNIPPQFYCNPNPIAAPEDSLQLEHSNSIDETSMAAADDDASSNTASSNNNANDVRNKPSDNNNEDNDDDDDDSNSSERTLSAQEEEDDIGDITSAAQQTREQ
ncbi:hypothetical protein RO3G_09281 [Lichtheimia corymbifera JMRC:FSU:9682]|uniref:Orc1-like AAA ATPase domain-containing protein n=1 Tax=Lichtheimia corymbifera JMRC:FSU:9682 TaxID=1263082 RepID=A0A068RNM3_9FUNG|nr:hypothetical protein RO3G_09281 [Lichtheimia corymbifera JMRC:FSU:9682]